MGLSKIWDNMSPEVTQNLVNSMNNRILAEIDAKGGRIKYL